MSVKNSSVGFASSVSPECGKEEGVEAAERRKKKKKQNPVTTAIRDWLTTRVEVLWLLPRAHRRHQQLGLRKGLSRQ